MARQVHVAPPRPRRRRVLAHAGKGLAFQGNASTITSQEYAELEAIELVHFGRCGGQEVDSAVDSDAARRRSARITTCSPDS